MIVGRLWAVGGGEWAKIGSRKLYECMKVSTNKEKQPLQIVEIENYTVQ